MAWLEEHPVSGRFDLRYPQRCCCRWLGLCCMVSCFDENSVMSNALVPDSHTLFDARFPRRELIRFVIIERDWMKPDEPE
jgi:hypothetical protein